MMVHELLTQLNNSGVVVRLKEDGNLAVTAPKGVMTAEIAGQIKNNKDALVTFLSNGASNGKAPSLPPIRPIERGNYLPISPAQERLWLLDQLSPDTAVYNLPFAFRLSGLLDMPALERSLHWVIQRHEGLRLQFQNVNGRPMAQLVKDLPEALPVVALGAFPENEREAQLQQLLYEHTQIPFDLALGPLFRVTLFRLAPDQHVLFFLVHHIIFDGWSADVLWQDIVSAYRTHDPAGARPSLAVQYVDYAAWYREWLTSEAAQTSFEYWKNQLQGPVESLILPVSRTPNTNQPYYEAQQRKFTISLALTEKIKALAQHEKATPFMVLLAAYKATLHAYSGQKDMIVCTPIAGRTVPDLNDLIGYFNNIVVLRTSLDQDPSFYDLLKRVQQTVLGANEHQTIPLQTVAELPDVRNVSLMRALFVLQDSVHKLESLPGIISSRVSVQENFDYVDVSIELFETDHGLDGQMSFKTALFDTDVVERFIENYLTTLHELVNNPALSLSALTRFEMPPLNVSVSDTESSREKRPFTPPRNKAETQLATIWGDLLGYDPVSIYDNFFEAGGHSLLAIQLFDQIEAITGQKLPLALLFEAPTIADLVAVLQDDSWEVKKSSVVAITGQKSYQEKHPHPFYCVIPPGDELLIFNDLAKAMGNERPFLGLQYGVHGETPITTVEEMATYFVQQITTENNKDPYFIGGYCFGGLIAYEMAQQLIAQGHQVGLVVLIDTDVPGSVWQLKSTLGKVLSDRLKSVRQNGIQKELVYTFERIANIWRLNIWQPIWQIVHKRYVNTGRKWPEILRDFNFINQNAINNYRVKPYHGSVILLQAKDRLPFYEYSPHLGWEEYVQEGFLTDHFIPGSHELLLRGSNAEVLAQEIKTALTAVTESKTTP